MTSKGEFKDTEVTVFAVDVDSGELASEKVSAPVEYVSLRSSTPVFVPVPVK